MFYCSFVHSRLEYGCAVLVVLVSHILRNWNHSNPGLKNMPGSPQDFSNAKLVCRVK